MTNRRIARRRGTSVDAVKFHIANIMDKTGLRDRNELRRWPSLPAGMAPWITRGGHTMENTTDLGRIGQISLTVNDIDRAVGFYRDVLKLPHLFTFGSLAFFDCDGVRLFLTVPEREEARQNSVIYFRVADIAASHRALAGAGVAFESAPHLIHRHADGTEEWMAFFSDPDENTLALMSQVRA
jgi:predicted enzyme related to lactoylglutathione lyase